MRAVSAKIPEQRPRSVALGTLPTSHHDAGMRSDERNNYGLTPERHEGFSVDGAREPDVLGTRSDERQGKDECL